MSTTACDIAIIGAGAAGLQLALALVNDDFFRDHQIVLIDPDEKNENDKTWCYWEKGAGQWDHLTRHQWNTALFHHEESMSLELAPYRYKMLRSIDFYTFAKTRLENAPNVTFIREKAVNVVENQKGASIQTEQQSVNCTWCFDSRVPEEFQKDTKHLHLLQHFKGWMVKFATPQFDPSTFTMMDFRAKYEGQTSFIYILPVSETEALLEYTFFTESTVAEEKYDELINNYIDQHFPDADYQVTETEQGVIPMSNYPFHKHNTQHIIKIGTGGGWVRPSTGYSFRNAGRYVEKIVANLKSGKHPATQLFKSKYRLYDTLLLDILVRDNKKGPALFEEMYRQNSVQKVLAFLDGETTLGDDIRMMMSFRPWPFMVSIYRRYLRFW